MLSGALIRLPEDLAIETLDGAVWEREERGLELKSVIQFQGRPVRVDRDSTAELALAIHQEIVKEPALGEENGRYLVSYQDTTVTKWAYIYLFQNFVVADRLANRGFVREIINKGLNLPHRSHIVYLDTARMVTGRADQWVRGFCDRMGRVDRGTVFGESVERDSVFGPELSRSTKKSVGWITNFFGSPVKVKVSPLGSVTVWANPPVGLFLRFLRMEIMPYIISLP